MKIFQSKAYKVIMGYVYGWGATAVIIGALFKIMHFPGAGIILTVGMLVEAFIFFLSAFEPPMEHYDWSRVFPVLGKGQGKEVQNTEKLSGLMKEQEIELPTNKQASISGNISLGLEDADLDKLKSGISRIAETAERFADLVEESPDLATKMKGMSTSFEELQKHTQDMASQIKNNCERFTQNMEESVSGFANLNRLMDEQYQQLKTKTSDYAQQLTSVNKNIGALNALYELQIKDTKDTLDSFRGIQGDMGEIMENVSLSLDSAKLFKQESQQLANHVASLNAIYGNMLSVVNNN